MATRLQEIAQSEQVDGQPIQAYVDLLTECSFNMRLALQRIATGVMIP